MRVKIGNYRSARAKKPRITNIQVHPWDTYSADVTLGMIIHPVLVAYKEDIVEKGAVPSDFLRTVDVSDMTDEEAQTLHDQLYKEGMQKWSKVLDSMIWSFEQVKDDYVGEEKFLTIRDENADVTDIANRYDIDDDGLNDYYEKIDEGLQLFGRYYRSLWW